MNITIVTIGSRGDTQPYLAVAQGLQRAGHQVRLCAGDNFGAWIKSYGVEFAPAGVDIQHFMNTRIPEVLDSGRNTFGAIRTVIREGLAFADQMWVGMQAACTDADLVATNFLGLGAISIAEARQIPALMLHSTPLIGRTAAAPPLTFPFQGNFGPFINRLLHDLTETFMQQGLRGPLNDWRREVGLAPLPRTGWHFDRLPNKTIPMLYGHSPTLLPQPGDWLPHWHVTGSWFLEEPAVWQPPADLVDFLHSGSKPVYIGFGSMSGQKPEVMTRLVLDALRQSGQRGVLASGWGSLTQTDLPDTVYALEEIPHSWLFPHVAAVVHHGGAGTTAAGLRAGVPGLVVPHFGDQYFWGRQLARLGVGPEPISRRRLTSERLAAAFTEAVTDADLRQRAAVIGERVRAEQGVENAVRLIEQYARSGA